MSHQCNPASVVYKSIPGLLGYRVGDDGSVWSCKLPQGHGSLSSCWRRLSVRRVRSYWKVKLSVEGKVYDWAIHRLVLTVFVGPAPDGCQACHNNGDTDDNRLANLRWDTPAANHLDRWKHGTEPVGSKNGRAKLTEDEVIEIRRRLRRGEKPGPLAQEFLVSDSTIQFIRDWVTWRHVKEDDPTTELS